MSLLYREFKYIFRDILIDLLVVIFFSRKLLDIFDLDV